MNINSRTSKVNFTGFASGSPATFTGLRDAPVNVISDVNAIQSGSGDPSPDNVRTIIPRDSVTITANSVDHEIDLVNDIYGGKLILQKGQNDKVLPWVKLVLDESITDNEILVANWNPYPNSIGFILKRTAIPDPVFVNMSDVSPAISDKLPTLAYNDLLDHDVIGISLSYSANYGIFVKIPDTTVTSKVAIRAYLKNNPITICYQVASPTEIILPTKTQIEQDIGSNSISSDAGNVEVYYVTI